MAIFSSQVKSILFIGLFQILALIPGVSRAGITLTAARFLKFNRVDSSKIAFLLSIPALAGASFLGLKDAVQQSIEFNYLLLIAITFSFVFSFAFATDIPNNAKTLQNVDKRIEYNKFLRTLEE